MSRPIQIDPQRPHYRAGPILDVVEEIPLEVVEAAPLELVKAASHQVEEIPLDVTESALPDMYVEPAVCRNLFVRTFLGIGSLVGWLFGLAALLVGLAV